MDIQNEQLVNILLEKLKEEGITVTVYEKYGTNLFEMIVDCSEHDNRVIEEYEKDRKSKKKKTELDACAMELAKANQSIYNNMMMNMCCCRVTPENDPYYAERLKCNGWTI